MSQVVNIIEGGAIAAAGGVVCFLLLWWRDRSLKEVKRVESGALLAKARSEAEAILQEARLTASKEALELRGQIEQSFAARRAERTELETRLTQREVLINSQLERIVEAEKNLNEQKAALRKRTELLDERDQALTELKTQALQQLQALAGLTPAEARETLLKKVEQQCLKDANTLSRHIIEEAKSKAEEKARQVITVAIQRYAAEHTFESTTASIVLNGDEMKGRIIGREGRNIRAFEAATGVTVLIDDTPGAVLLSGFDPVRREIARESMIRLIADGRIHPTRIEEVVEQVSQEMNETVVRIGEAALIKVGLPPAHPEIVKLLGRLHFRHSYSQNLLDHSVEVAHLVGLMAGELGIEMTTAKRAGLFHDIGKAVNHEVEGPHAVVGAEILKRYGETEAVVNGVASHHADVPPIGPLGILVSAADAISASRPGARSENMTTYLKRVEDLEKLAGNFEGVEKAFALQAGRELRVFVRPDHLDDEECFALARSIASQIENDLQYPGQIKITVIRETRCVEVAK
jgi:ribonucrease Y